MPDRYVHAIFCDDVRDETGGKNSLMGIYHGSLYVPSFPTVLPKFCVAFAVVSPVKKPLKSLTVKVFADDVEIASADVGADNSQSSEKARTRVLRGNIIFTPFPIHSSAVLRVHAVTESEVLQSGGLQIDLSSNDETMKEVTTTQTSTKTRKKIS